MPSSLLPVATKSVAGPESTVGRALDYVPTTPVNVSDLERFPTLNLKFDKEIPDVLEHFMFGAGRLVLHVADERKSIVLDNVLWSGRVADPALAVGPAMAHFGWSWQDWDRLARATMAGPAN